MNVRQVVRQQIVSCTRCPLHTTCHAPVPFSGSPASSVLVIGEAPGATEDAQGKPFVGPAGRLLNTLLAQSLGLPRGAVMVANAVCCRPPANRDPLPAEIDACRANLTRQLLISRARWVILAGRFALAQFRPHDQIGKFHGVPFHRHGRVFYPIHHPAAALYSRNLEPTIRADLEFLRVLMISGDAGLSMWPAVCVNCGSDVGLHSDPDDVAYCNRCWPKRLKQMAPPTSKMFDDAGLTVKKKRRKRRGDQVPQSA